MIGLPWHKIAMNSVGTIIITTTSSQGPLLSPLSSRCGEVRLYINIPGGWGVLAIMAYAGRLRPKGIPFSGLRYMKGRGILLAEVYQRMGKSVIWVFERAQGADR